MEPSDPSGRDLRERATAAASSVPEVREVHNVRVMHLPEGYELSLHVKLPSELSLTESHGVVERLEGVVFEAIPELRNVHTHIEPLAGTDWASRPARDDTATEREAIEDDGAAHHRRWTPPPSRSATARAAGSRWSRSSCRATSRCPPPTGTPARSRRPCASAARRWAT